MRFSFKKTLATILSIALILSSFVGAFSASAAEASVVGALSLEDVSATLDDNNQFSAVANISLEQPSSYLHVAFTLADLPQGVSLVAVSADTLAATIVNLDNGIDAIYLEGDKAAVSNVAITFTFVAVDSVDFTLAVNKIFAMDDSELDVNINVSDSAIVSVQKQQSGEPEPEYTNLKYGISRSVRIVEPWGITFKTYPVDGNNSNKPVPLSEFSDYGYYVLPSYKVPEGTEITLDYLAQNGKKISGADITKEKDGAKELFCGTFKEDLFTYMMGADIYYLTYVVSNTVVCYDRVRTTSLLTTINDVEATVQKKLDNGTSTNVAKDTDEVALLQSMKVLYEKVTEHRGTEYSEFEERDIPRTTDTVFANKDTSASAPKIAHTRSLRLIEPWGLRISCTIYDSAGKVKQPLSNYKDYGVVLLKESDFASGVPTSDEILTNPNSYVFSKSNGFAEPAKNDNGTISVDTYTLMFDDAIYTYQLNETYYFVRYYVTDNGMVYDASPKSTSIEATANDVLGKQDITATERAVLNAIKDLKPCVDAYRAHFDN